MLGSMSLTREQLRLVAAIIGVAVAVSICIFACVRFFGDPAPEIGKDQVWLIDTETGESWSVTAGEYREMAAAYAKSENMTVTMYPGQIRFEHPKTGKNTVAFAEKCANCAEVFRPDYMNAQDYFDRCPACGYSHYATLRGE